MFSRQKSNMFIGEEKEPSSSSDSGVESGHESGHDSGFESDSNNGNKESLKTFLNNIRKSRASHKVKKQPNENLKSSAQKPSSSSSNNGSNKSTQSWLGSSVSSVSSVFRGNKSSASTDANKSKAEEPLETLESGIKKIIACETSESFRHLYYNFLAQEEKNPIATCLIKKLIAWYLVSLDKKKSKVRLAFLAKYNEVRESSDIAFTFSKDLSDAKISSVVFLAQRKWDPADPDKSWADDSEERGASIVLQIYCEIFSQEHNFSFWQRQLSQHASESDLRVEMSFCSFVEEALKSERTHSIVSAVLPVEASDFRRLSVELLSKNLFKENPFFGLKAKIVPLIAKFFVFLENEDSPVFQAVAGRYLVLKNAAGYAFPDGFFRSHASVELKYANIVRDFYNYQTGSELSYALEAFIGYFPLQALEVCVTPDANMLRSAVEDCRKTYSKGCTA